LKTIYICWTPSDTKCESISYLIHSKVSILSLRILCSLVVLKSSQKQAICSLGWNAFRIGEFIAYIRFNVLIFVLQMFWWLIFGLCLTVRPPPIARAEPIDGASLHIFCPCNRSTNFDQFSPYLHLTRWFETFFFAAIDYNCFFWTILFFAAIIFFYCNCFVICFFCGSHEKRPFNNLTLNTWNNLYFKATL
jgi:hypothetical protein